MPKAADFVALAGNRAYWNPTAGNVTWRRGKYYLGRFGADAAYAATTCEVNLNVDPPYDLDIARDPFITAMVGTQALGGLALNRRGGCHNAVLSSLSEAQKVDALSKTYFETGDNAIVEFGWAVVNDGAGSSPDLSVGVASGTHATDADSIAQHLLMHLDGNSTTIKFQSKDGTTTVAATDSTKTYTEGAMNRKECWFDLRDPTAAKVYVDGVLIATTHNVSAAASPWYLLFHLEKTSSADIYEFDLEWLRARTAKQ